MEAQLARALHRMLDLIPGVHPNERAELHEHIGESTAAQIAATPPAPPAEPQPPQAPPAPAGV